MVRFPAGDRTAGATVLMGGAGSAGNEPLLAVGAGVIVLFALASVVFSRAVQDGRVDD